MYLITCHFLLLLGDKVHLPFVVYLNTAYSLQWQMCNCLYSVFHTPTHTHTHIDIHSHIHSHVLHIHKNVCLHLVLLELKCFTTSTSDRLDTYICVCMCVCVCFAHVCWCVTLVQQVIPTVTAHELNLTKHKVKVPSVEALPIYEMQIKILYLHHI